MSMPGKIENALTINKTELPETLKDNYSYTPDASKTKKSLKSKTLKKTKPRRKQKKGKRSTRKRVNFLGFKF